MSRSFALTLVIPGLILGLIALLGLPLDAQETREAQQERLDKAEVELEEATDAYEEILREMEHDFDLIRGEHWVKIAMKFELAIEAEVELLREDAEHDLVEGLDERFFDISAVCPVTFSRLIKAIEGPVREAAKKEGEFDSEAILAAGLKAVFPEEKFKDNWDKHFMDLPEIIRIDKAEADYAAAKTALEKPILPPLPECDGPEGTVYVPKGRYAFGPWTGWEFDLKKNKAGKAATKGFYIDAFEVTNREYLTFLEGVKDKALVTSYLPEDFKRAKDGTITIPKGSDWLPVTGITVGAATAYATSVGKRLPTEEEWEGAARGEKGLIYPWGMQFKKDHANSMEGGQMKKMNVGANPKDKSPFGAYDMAGNVSEMTSYIEGRSPLKGKPKATDNIITRGGNYEENKDSLVTSHRWTLRATDGKSTSVGFRCVVSEAAWKAKDKDKK